MHIDLARIPDDGLVLEGDEPDCEIDWARGPAVHAQGPVHYRLVARIVTGELLVDGALSVLASVRCSRCAESYGAEIREPAYHYDQPVTDATASVDLTEDMREAMILAFPSYPICEVTCKGLCPACGANLNRGTCDCRAPEERRWSALDTLNELK